MLRRQCASACGVHPPVSSFGQQRGLRARSLGSQTERRSGRQVELPRPRVTPCHAGARALPPDCRSRRDGGAYHPRASRSLRAVDLVDRSPPSPASIGAARAVSMLAGEGDERSTVVGARYLRVSTAYVDDRTTIADVIRAVRGP